MMLQVDTSLYLPIQSDQIESDSFCSGNAQLGLHTLSWTEIYKKVFLYFIFFIFYNINKIWPLQLVHPPDSC